MISNAYAQAAAPASQGDPLPSLFIIVGMFVLMYFLMIRPQQKKAKEHKQMVDGLQKGDEVIAMGIIVRITKISDTPNVITVVHKAIQRALPRAASSSPRLR